MIIFNLYWCFFILFLHSPNFFVIMSQGDSMQEILKRIYDYSLEEVMETRFASYAKSIIQDRALPDVRDGLKPVQRRILYSMYKEKHTYDKPTVKSARCVGDIMGKFHPHGDSSIYEAMVRMSQWWKQNTLYIDMQGNNGSMDGDSAAAMRYTEARLSKVSNELLKDIDKDTVTMTWNFDDTLLEPTVLPAKFPNLLVNGANGISAGYATNIPPHNLGEVIDATIKRIDSPNCRLDTILEIVKGPDFPTGGIVEGKNGIIDAFTTGRGKVIIRSKIEFLKEKGKVQILITEIPFDVNKALLCKKIDEIRIDKKVDGISEIRDESDGECPVRIVIDLKKDADKELVLNYLLKNTDLQISYNYNMVAIVNERPMTLGILSIIDAYIAHQKEVITKRTKFDLDHALKRMHIVEGLIRCFSILDDVIKTIRASKNKADAKVNLVKEFAFSEEQAIAILDLQLYRLTNLDVNALEEEQKNLALIIQGLESILNSEEKLKIVMKEELRKIKNEYAIPRKTEIRDEITEIKIDTTKMISKEDCMVVVTNEGYTKRVSLRSYDDNSETMLKEGDFVTGKYKMSTMDTLLLFTDFGNYLYVPIHELPDLKWKELGKHISNLIAISSEEHIIGCIPVYNFETKDIVTIFTQDGMIKRSLLADFKVQRYSRPLTAIKLKPEDRVVSVTIANEDCIFVTTANGYGLWYDTSEVPVTGVKSSGVKSITLKNDKVVSGHIFHSDMEYLTVITDKGTGKRIKLTEFEKTSRARKGIQIIREVKTNPYHIVKSFIIGYKESIVVATKDEFLTIKLTELPIGDRYATGSTLVKQDILAVFKVAKVIEANVKEEVVEKENISLETIDDKMMTIDDFLKDMEK